MRKAGFFSVEIEGLNLNRLINELTQKNIRLYGVKKKGVSNLTLSVNFLDKKNLIAHLKEKCYNIRVLNDLTPKSGVLVLFKRMGLAIGALAIIALTIAYSCFVWHIDISGNERLTDAQILALINQSGVKQGTSKNAIDIDALELAIGLDPDIVAVSVKIHGTRLVVSVTETLAPSDVIDLNKRRDIVSDCDGVVGEVLVLAGTARVKTGDIVKAGDILIEGTTTKGEDEPLRECYALGTVMVSRFFRGETLFSTTSVGYRRTGKTQTASEILLFDKPLVKAASLPDFAKYETESTKKPLFTPQLLPLEKRSITYYEVEPFEQIADLEERAKEEQQRLTQQMLANHLNDRVLSTKSVLSELAGLYKLEIYIEVECKFS